MPNFKKLSVIIVSYQGDQYLPDCLTSVYEKLGSFFSIEIVVVNNNTHKKINLNDLTNELKNLKVINLEKNIGYGAGNNLGVKNANGELLLFLNPDTKIISVQPEIIALQFENSPNTAILGARLVDLKGQNQPWSSGLAITPLDTVLNNLGFIRSQRIWQSHDCQNVDWVSGAALFMRRTDFEKMGGFDENFFLYFEDIDLCRRTKKNNKKIIYFPSFTVEHRCGASFKNKSQQKSEFYKSQDYYFKKHFGKSKSLILKALRRVFH
jgi:GT2 family glycosyltransferase